MSGVTSINQSTAPVRSRETASDTPVRPSLAPETASSLRAADQAAASGAARGGVPASALQLTAPATPSQTAAQPAKKDEPNPWRIRSVNVDYGLMFDVRYSNSDIRLQRPGDGTDVILHDVAAHDRTSAHFLYSMPNGHPQPDEPQYDAGIAVQFANNWGVELNVKHNKYVVITGEDPDQQIHMTGTLHGQAIDETRSLRSVMPTYQITNGLNQISVMATRAFELPAPGNHRLTYNLKAGPSVYMPYTKGTVVNGDGSTTDFSGPYHFSGWGGVAEHSLRYEIPVGKRGAISTELLHGVTYANIPKSLVAGGHASQSLWANQLGLTVGYTFRFGK